MFRSAAGGVGIPFLIAALLVGAATPASADDRRCGERGRPACSILRPPDLDVPDHPPARTGLECVALVGGFDSTNGDDTFDDLLHWTQDAPAYQTFRFGDFRSETFTYKTTGAIDRSAEDLTRWIRSFRDECAAIHVVTHSMGGAVADRAFSMGLSAADGIATYIALSGPHNGATLARELRHPIESDPLIAIEASVLARAIDQPDPTTRAAHDLARTSAPRELRKIAHARLRYATDAMVLRRDNYDRRVPVREYMPRSLSAAELVGHGAILHNAEVRDAVSRSIATREIAADARSATERVAAEIVSRRVDEELSAVYSSLSLYLKGDPMAPYALAGVTIAAVIARVVGDALDPDDEAYGEQ